MATKSKIEEYLEVERIENVKARRHILYFAHAIHEGYDLEWFHVLVYKYIEKWVRKEIRKLAIFIPPQHGKSVMSSITNPAYLLGRNPKAKVVCASYAEGVASKFNRACQDLMSTQRYRDIFPDSIIPGIGTGDRGNELRNSKYFELLGEKGSYKSVGVGGSLTSETVEYGIIDDPIKDRIEANSTTYRERLWDWYNDVWSTRMNNDSCELMLFTRWHEDDLAGRIFDPTNEHYDKERADQYTVIVLPALKEDVPSDILQAIDINDPREVGEALWEAKHSRETHEQHKRNAPYMFASLKQQRPSPLEGGLFKREWFDIVAPNALPFNPEGIPPHFMIDGAYTDKTSNDPTAIMSYRVHEGTLYIFNVQSVRLDLSRFLPFAGEYMQKQGYTTGSHVRAEFKASGPGMISMLKKEEYGGFNVSRINERHVQLGKYTRGEYSTPSLAAGRVKLVQGEWNKSFISQCITFPNGVHDDEFDLLCYAVLHEIAAGSRIKRRKSSFNKRREEKRTTHDNRGNLYPDHRPS